MHPIVNVLCNTLPCEMVDHIWSYVTYEKDKYMKNKSLHMEKMVNVHKELLEHTKFIKILYDVVYDLICLDNYTVNTSIDYYVSWHIYYFKCKSTHKILRIHKMDDELTTNEMIDIFVKDYSYEYEEITDDVFISIKDKDVFNELEKEIINILKN